MSDYTPTTQRMRDHFGDSGWFVKDDGDVEHNTVELEDMFDRWLAQHDAEVRADEREQAARRVERSLRTRGTTKDDFLAAVWGEDDK